MGPSAVDDPIAMIAPPFSMNSRSTGTLVSRDRLPSRPRSESGRMSASAPPPNLPPIPPGLIAPSGRMITSKRSFSEPASISGG